MADSIPPPLPVHRPQSTPLLPPLSTELGGVAAVLFLALATLLLLLGQSPAWRGPISSVSLNFLAILVEALPFMLLGSLSGGLIEVFVPAGLAERLVRPNRIRAVLLAGLLGMVLPVCECAIVPVVRRLLGKGVPLSAALTFLLAGPIVNPIVAVSTLVAYSGHWPMAAARIGCGYLIAVTIGLVAGILYDRTPERGLAEGAGTNALCGHPQCSHSAANTSIIQRLRHALSHACDDLFSVGCFLVAGAFFAALVRGLVPMSAFSHLQASPWQAIVLMMGLAMALSLCSEADAFLAAGFRGLLPGSAQLAFLVLGPMFDLKLLLMYSGLFRLRLIVLLGLSLPLAVLLASLGLDLLLPALL